MAEKTSTQFMDKNVVAQAEIGKMPPQVIDLEEAVLGAVMLEKDAIISVMEILKPEYFYLDNHQKIFTAIVELATNHEAVDILTVTERLRKQKNLDIVGGAVYIAQLTGKVPSAVNVEFHARIIAQKYIQRELIRVSSEIQRKAFDAGTDVDDLLDYSERELFGIAEGHIRRESSKLNVLLKEAINQIEESSRKEDSLIGVPSGFTRIDRITSGWQKSDLIIVAARPSMGKTAFVLSMARNITVEHKRPVALFSLEMSSIQLVNRMIVSETELPSDKIRNGRLKDYEWEQLHYKVNTLIDAPLFIDDTPALSIFELRAKCRRLKANHNIQLVIVDYLQLMSGPGDNRMNREQEVSIISRSLKGIAKELDIPIIALSQLNRSVESRGGYRRPMLSDLRESGAIEQDADLVIFIHRPEKYNITEDADGVSTIGMAEIIIAKHRNGPIGDVKLKFKEESAKFIEISESITPVDDMSPEQYSPYQAVTFGSKMNVDNPAQRAPRNFYPDGPPADSDNPF
mgnify:CR=1 FL=1